MNIPSTNQNNLSNILDVINLLNLNQQGNNNIPIPNPLLQKNLNLNNQINPLNPFNQNMQSNQSNLINPQNQDDLNSININNNNLLNNLEPDSSYQIQNQNPFNNLFDLFNSMQTAQLLNSISTSQSSLNQNLNQNLIPNLNSIPMIENKNQQLINHSLNQNQSQGQNNNKNNNNNINNHQNHNQNNQSSSKSSKINGHKSTTSSSSSSKSNSFINGIQKIDDKFKKFLEFRKNATNIVYVEGIPLDTTEREIAHIFRPFTGFKSVRLIAKEKSGEKTLICFADFNNILQSTVCINTLQGYRFDKNDLVGLHFSYGVTKKK
jgi:hypothetical protein